MQATESKQTSLFGKSKSLITLQIAWQFADFTGTDRIYIGDTGAFYSDNIGAEDVKLFLSKQTYKPLVLLSEAIEFFVWLAVFSKPSIKPIWLKVKTHFSLELQGFKVLKMALGFKVFKI